MNEKPTPQDIKALVDWALRSAGTIITLSKAPEAIDDDMRLEKLELYEEANHFMLDAMPERLVKVASDISDRVGKQVEEDLLVAEFRQEMDEHL